MKQPDAAFFDAVDPHHRLLVCIKGSPDPDALASAFVCKLLCERAGKRCRVVATQRLALRQNTIFVRRLALPLEVVDDFSRLASWADAYIVVDHASAEVDGLSERLPCAVHIDHHEAVPAPFPIAMRWCRTNVGSTSTLVSQVLRARHDELQFSDRDMRRMATALLFGIQTDTDQYALATDPDYEAIRFLSPLADTAALKRLSGVPLGRTTMQCLERAKRDQTVYKGWLFTGVGFVPHQTRDDIAIVADVLLRREDVSLVVVFALVEDDRKQKLVLDASVRTKDPKLKLNHLIRRIAPDGGGRKFKGAFQAKLDYLQSVSQRDELWALVERATIEKLVRARDAQYKVKLQGLVDRAGETASHVLTGMRGSVWHGVRGALAAYRDRAK